MRKSDDLWVYTSEREAKFWIQTRTIPRVVHKPKKFFSYLDITCTLDIETTCTKEDGFLYTIQFNVGGQNFLFRYIEDWIEFINSLTCKWKIHLKRRLVFYIHFLGYEHMFLTQVLAEAWGIEDALLTKKRKPLYILYGNGIEFRDSFKLFQKSLKGATKGLPHEKAAGDMDFRQYRTPDTPLSPDEFHYCVNDVQGLWEAIVRIKLERGFDAATIPITNTAMVIQEINRKISKDKETLDAMERVKLDKHAMKLAYRTMAGGDTHGNRRYAGKLLKNCNSVDLKSAHPSQQLLKKFPMGKPQEMGEMDEIDARLLLDRGYGWIAQVGISNFRVKTDNPDPTLSLSRFEELQNGYGTDNGRLMGGEAGIVYMDSNDYIRFSEGYEYEEFWILDGIFFKLDYLPRAFREGIRDFFIIKESGLKGPDYMFAKICINTIFGACAQKTIRDEYALEVGDMMNISHISWEDNLKDSEDDRVFRSQRLKLPFLWGLWTSSCTRLDLWNVIKTVGWKNAIYWDTDSVKYHGEKCMEIEAYNSRVRALCQERDAVILNGKGEEVYIGVAEDEHPDQDYGYAEFKFLHAKCYADQLNDGSIECTIAGVSKEAGKEALKGDIGNLEPGLYIEKAGGSALQYIDRVIMTRTDFSRPTAVASFIYSEDRQYLVQDGIRDYAENFDFEIVSD